MTALGFNEFIIRINNRKILEAYARYLGAPKEKMTEIYRAIDQLEKGGWDRVKRELKERGLEQEIIDEILTLFKSQDTATNSQRIEQLKGRLNNIPEALEGLSEVEEVLGILREEKITEDYMRFDPTMVRGLDYYTGVIFEVGVTAGGVGAVGGGGRYDNLLESFTGRRIAATGIGWGFERLVDVIRERGLIKAPKTNTSVLVTIFSADYQRSSLKIANRLRETGINTEIYLEPGDDLRRQLDYANKKGIPYVVLLGPQEAERNQVTLKEMKTGKQESFAPEKLVEILKSRL